MISEFAKAVLALLFAVALAYVLIIFTQQRDVTGQAPRGAPSIYDARIMELDREAIEEAYKKHVHLLFDNWVKDPVRQPARALTGIDMGRRAYIDSMTGLDARRARDGTLPPTPRSIEKNVTPQGK